MIGQSINIKIPITEIVAFSNLDQGVFVILENFQLREYVERYSRVVKSYKMNHN